MTKSNHPSPSDLWAALHEPAWAAETVEHASECLACRVRISRIERAINPSVPTDDALGRIIHASNSLVEGLAFDSGEQPPRPEPGEIWRIGRTEALLAWVRRVFDDGIVEVIPLVLDVELADQESIVIDRHATPLDTEVAALVALRTHVSGDAFMNLIGSVDIRKEVAEVMLALREDRLPRDVRLGTPLESDDDQRIEYRQVMRDLLAELSPSAWHTAQQADPPASAGTQVDRPSVAEIKARLQERLRGAKCRYLDPRPIELDLGLKVEKVLKVNYLDTAVLVAIIDGSDAFPEFQKLVKVCRTMTHDESDVDAIAVAIPTAEWSTMLFTTADMRNAFGLPNGEVVGPAATLEDHGLVDTLCKHFEGAVSSWEVTERAERTIGRTNLRQIAARHATTSIQQVAVEGGRAHQVAKKNAWGNLPTGLDERVVKFILAVASQEPLDSAIAEFVTEARDD